MDNPDAASQAGGNEMEEPLAFSFFVDGEGYSYFEQVIGFMCEYFDISEDETVARVNDIFVGSRFVGYDILYHDTAEDCGKSLMYKTPFWWLDEANAELRAPPLGFKLPE